MLPLRTENILNNSITPVIQISYRSSMIDITCNSNEIVHLKDILLQPKSPIYD